MKKTGLLALMTCIVAFATAQIPQDARKAMENENYFKARDILQKQIATGPTTELWYYLGVVYQKLDKTDSAKLLFRKAAASDESKNPFLYLGRGRLAMLEGKSQDAEDAFNKAVSVSKSKNASVFYQIGDAYFKAPDPDIDQAMDYFEKAYAQDPGLIINLLEYGDAFLAKGKGDPGSARTKYELAVSEDPNSALAHYKLGNLDALAGLHKNAIKSLEKATELDPELAAAWKLLGEEYYFDKQYSKVPACFEKYVELNEEDTEARMVPCILYYQLSDYRDAISCSEDVLGDDPENYVAQRIVGYANYEIGDSLENQNMEDTAMYYFRKGYQAMESFWNIQDKKVKDLDFVYSARLAVQMQDTQKAEFFYAQALQSDTANPELEAEYAKYLYYMHQYKEAIRVYNEKMQRFGFNALDAYFLGRSYYNDSDYVNADSTFAKFVADQPTSPDGYWWMAKCSVKIETANGGDISGLALPYYQKYIEVATPDSDKYRNNLFDAHIYCAIYYYKNHKDTMACDHYHKAKALVPENKTYDDIFTCPK